MRESKLWNASKKHVMRGFSEELQFINLILATVKECRKAAKIAAVRIVADIALKSTQKETGWMIFKHFLETTSTMALILSINNKANNANLEKIMETWSTISDSIANQSLEFFVTS